MTTAWRGKALIADDDPRNRKLMNTLLRAEGYEVRCVESGAATLAAIADEVPDVLLLDLMMPGMDGFEVVRRLKAGPATRGIAIVMVTALDDEASRSRLAAAGVADVLTKPIDRWELKACLERLVDGGKP
jgi:CheY-like chemotaxis protein